MTDKSLTRRNLLSGSAGLAAGAVLMTGMNASAAGLEESLEKNDPVFARFFKYFDEEEVAQEVEPVLGKTRRHFVSPPNASISSATRRSLTSRGTLFLPRARIHARKRPWPTTVSRCRSSVVRRLAS